MRYRITVWKYDGATLSHRSECLCETHWQAIEMFAYITRGVQGYYRAWLVDEQEEKEVRYSSVLTNEIGG